MNVGKILIIDDEEKLRQLLVRIIGLEGFEVIEASNLKVGLKKLEQNNIDVVICDVKLPDGNGVDLIQKIKAINPAIPTDIKTVLCKTASDITIIMRVGKGNSLPICSNIPLS